MGCSPVTQSSGLVTDSSTSKPYQKRKREPSSRVSTRRLWRNGAAWWRQVLGFASGYLDLRLAVLQMANAKLALGRGSESQVAQRLWRFDPVQLQREHVQPASCGVTCTCGCSAFAQSRTWYALSPQTRDWLINPKPACELQAVSRTNL